MEAVGVFGEEDVEVLKIFQYDSDASSSGVDGSSFVSVLMRSNAAQFAS